MYLVPKTEKTCILGNVFYNKAKFYNYVSLKNLLFL